MLVYNANCLMWTNQSILAIRCFYSVITILVNNGYRPVFDDLSVCAGLFLIIGVGLANKNNSPYAGTLEITGALLAWLGAIFLIIQIVVAAVVRVAEPELPRLNCEVELRIVED